MKELGFEDRRHMIYLALRGAADLTENALPSEMPWNLVMVGAITQLVVAYDDAISSLDAARNRNHELEEQLSGPRTPECNEKEEGE